MKTFNPMYDPMNNPNELADNDPYFEGDAISNALNVPHIDQPKELEDVRLEWGSPRRVSTQRGPRDLRTAPATRAFWQVWEKNKDALKAAGISCSKDDTPDGTWEVLWWIPVSDEGAEPSEPAETGQEKETPEPLDLAALKWSFRPNEAYGIFKGGTADLTPDVAERQDELEKLGFFFCELRSGKFVKMTEEMADAGWTIEWRENLQRRLPIPPACDNSPVADEGAEPPQVEPPNIL